MNILSLNGGGSSGYITALILAKLEKEYNNKHICAEMFDLIAGVSTGSIIGALLAKGLPAQEVVELYRKFIPEIFGHRNWIPLFKPLYNRKSLVKLLSEHLNLEMKDCKTRFMAHAVSVSKPMVDVEVFKSWDERFNSFKLYDICLASSAAPVFFEPHCFNGKRYIDGSLATNNPSMNAISQALRLNVPLENIYNVNISCSDEPGYDEEASLKSIFNWAPKISGIFCYACSDAVHYQAHSLIGFNNHFIQPDINLALDSKDLSQMEEVANCLWEKHGPTICQNVFF